MSELEKSTDEPKMEFNTFFDKNDDNEEEVLSIEDKIYPSIEDKIYPAIEDKTYPGIEDKTYTPIETTSKSLLKGPKDYKSVLNNKVKYFVESLKEEGIEVTYDSYEFDKLFEFIIKINKE